MKIKKRLNTAKSKLPFFAMALLPLTLSAQLRIPLQGSFTVSAEATPNIGGSSFCGGPPGLLAIEAHGAGFSTLGPFTFTLHKTAAPGATPADPIHYHGCLVLTAPNGDSLNATYDLTQPAELSDFANANGTLTITGGSGLYKGASGTLKATGIFLSLYPSNSFAGGGTGPLQVSAHYVIDGAVSLSRGF